MKLRQRHSTAEQGQRTWALTIVVTLIMAPIVIAGILTLLGSFF